MKSDRPRNQRQSQQRIIAALVGITALLTGAFLFGQSRSKAPQPEKTTASKVGWIFLTR